VPYQPWPELAPLPEFAGSASSRADPTLQVRVEAFIVEQYADGRSFRELAEATDRSFSAVRNTLGQAWGPPPRGRNRAAARVECLTNTSLAPGPRRRVEAQGPDVEAQPVLRPMATGADGTGSVQSLRWRNSQR
jgi:hypothetical protein